MQDRAHSMVDSQSETVSVVEPSSTNTVVCGEVLSQGMGSTTTTTGRRRALSVASTQPSVETVIVKAKRAAHSLWMLLHAQNCMMASSCPHVGCKEAKLLHLHIKTCPASEGFPCPTSHHGCDQAKKLLAHYRRCRNTRARQLSVLSGRRDPGQHHCLVCSLVARQARHVLETSTSTATSSSTSLSSSSGKHSMVVHSARQHQHSRQVITTSFMPAQLNTDEVLTPPNNGGGERGMPPPAPRLPPFAATFSSSDMQDEEVPSSTPDTSLKRMQVLPNGSSVEKLQKPWIQARTFLCNAELKVPKLVGTPEQIKEEMPNEFSDSDGEMTSTTGS